MLWACLGSSCNAIPQRYVVAIMVLTGLAIQYINRLAFNLTITLITHKINLTDESNTLSVCPTPNATTVEKELESMAEFNWSSTEQGNVLGAFYIGYIVTHLPGGYLADKYGPKRVLGYGVLMAALCSILTPVTARTHIYLLTGLRFALGLIQGPIFPALSVFVARWSLPSERNLMNAVMSAGVIFGAITANALTGVLLYTLRSWAIVFYIYGIVSLCWYVPWTLFSHEGPSTHPFITEKEKEKLLSELSTEVKDGEKAKVPYNKILTSIPVWAMIIGNIGHDWTFYIIVTLLPQYMSYVLHFNIKDNGLINTLPYIAMFMISLSSAKLADTIVKREWVSKTTQSKTYLIICNSLPCLLYIGATYVGCDRLVVVIMFTASMGIMGMIYSSVRVCNVDMSPNFAGTLMSLMNGMGSLCGYLGPVMFGYFTQDGHSLEAWRNAFFATTVFVGITTVIFTIFGTSKIQPWNFPEEENQDNTDENEESA